MIRPVLGHPEFKRCICVWAEFQAFRVAFLVIGGVLILVAPVLGGWVPFYYTSGMTVGILLVVLFLLFQVPTRLRLTTHACCFRPTHASMPLVHLGAEHEAAANGAQELFLRRFLRLRGERWSEGWWGEPQHPPSDAMSVSWGCAWRRWVRGPFWFPTSLPQRRPLCRPWGLGRILWDR